MIWNQVKGVTQVSSSQSMILNIRIHEIIIHQKSVPQAMLKDNNHHQTEDKGNLQTFLKTITKKNLN